MEEQTAPASAETGLTGHRRPVRPVVPAEPDQIDVAPISRVLVSWIHPPFDMVVDMALESTRAKFPHVPTPN